MKKIFYHILLLFSIFPVFCFAQTEETTYRSEISGSVASGEDTPFWMVNKTWGMMPLRGGNFYIRGAVFHNHKVDKEWSFNFGFDLAGSSPHSYSSVWVQQAYGELNYKKGRINVGVKEDYISLLDPSLSSGDFSYSNSVRPNPEIKFSTSDFIVVPYTKELLSISGHFAVGEFSDGNYLEDITRQSQQAYTKGTLSHHKAFYLRLGNFEEGHKWRFVLGANHHAQWGGRRYDGSGKFMHKNPSSFKDFIRAITGKEGGANAVEGDQLNASGSHVGSYMAKLEYKLENDDELSLYCQHFFEDESGIFFHNYKDQLLGFQYKRKEKALVSNVLIEYIYTKQQSNPIHFGFPDFPTPVPIYKYKTGNDDYYNNFDYTQGRSYYGRSMGSPLLLSPEYNRDGKLLFKSNRIIAYHLGAEGYLSKDLQYRILMTYGKTWGRYRAPYLNPHEGFAYAIDLKYALPRLDNCDLKFSIGHDIGKFYRGDSFGMGISLVKRGVIRFLNK